MSKQAQIGLLVAIVCGILLGLAPTQRRRAPILGTLYKLSFHGVEGLKLGDPVVLGGVPAGRVVGIDFAPRKDWETLSPGQPDVPMVLVTVAMERRLLLPANSAHKIVATLKGTHFINIVPGPPGSKLPPNSILTDELRAEKEDTLNATFKNMRMLAKRTEDLRRQFSDPQFRRDMKDGASNARFYSHEFLAASANATSRLKSMEGQLSVQEQNMIEQTQRLDQKAANAEVYIHRIIPRARQQLGDYRRRLSQAQSQMDAMYSQADKVNAQMQGFAKRLDTEMLGRIDTKKLSKTARDAARRLDDMYSLAGDLHAISSDTQVRNDIKAIFKRFKVQAETMKTNVQKYEGIFDNFQWLMSEEKEHKDEP